MAAVCGVALGCGGVVTAPDGDAGAALDVATDAAPDAAYEASPTACMWFWCGDQWLPCDETGHAICKNRKAVCVFDPAAPPCDAGAD